LIESALERISLVVTMAASVDEIFLETARFLSLCSREITSSISLVKNREQQSQLETVLTCVMALDETMKVLRENGTRGKCTGPQDFDWFRHFRYYFNTSRGCGAGNMMVEVAGVKRPYTFQPVSGTDAVALPMVAASARAAVAIACVVSGYMIPVLVGPTGAGKCNIVRSVAAWLGQPCLFIDACCEATASNRWANAVAGSGYWGVVTNSHKLCLQHSSSSATLHCGSHEGAPVGNPLLFQISVITRTLAELADRFLFKETP
jgi:hypothetical protein